MTAEQSDGAEHIHDSIDRLNTGAQQIADSSAAFADVTRRLQDTAEELKSHVSSIAIGAESEKRG